METKLAILADTATYDAAPASSGVKRSSRGGWGSRSGVRAMLLRWPGLGVRNVNRILGLRRERPAGRRDLRRLRVSWRRALPFLVTADFNPAVLDLDQEAVAVRTAPRDRQLELFAAAASAENGEL